ncbi:class I SAM-dependent methyltransferase [Pseudoalteromonas sp. H105]|uniref:class I SAM-dependent methyltransferase n=1 Tax=Pseudoalteromonas sp. H105 TaxID=1348393 RepID=UPI00073223C1|nr:class I SAM-dependent methyltransferase [Pseudoalteromonas sp. H105]KTF16986.1 tellurite resistance protein [Pseudoalteromonas sp. H105]
MSNSSIDYYNQHSAAFIASSVNVDMSPLYDEFLPLLPAHAAILDAGCGTGRDAQHFIQSGFTVTAIDASQALVEFASKHLGQPVIHKTFKEIDDMNAFDGIWCCASLLHVPKVELPQVFLKLQNALKPNGVLYVSFKYGTQERVHNGREFTDLNEDGLTALITQHTELKIIKQWQTIDQRPERESEVWLNALIKAVPVL